MSEAFRTHVRTRLTDLLPRHRGTIIFPLDREEVYRAAFPETPLCDWLFDPLPTDLKRRGLAYRNVINSTFRGPVAHFCLNTPQELDDMQDLSDRSIFWLKFPRHVVCSSDTWAFELNESMRTNKALLDWYNQAWSMEDQLWHFTHKVYSAIQHLANPSEFAIAWPEVANAVPDIVPPQAKLRAAARSPRIKALRDKITDLFPPDEMETFSNLLAAALLLPPAYRPDAWVGLLDKEIEL